MATPLERVPLVAKQHAPTPSLSTRLAWGSLGLLSFVGVGFSLYQIYDRASSRSTDTGNIVDFLSAIAALLSGSAGVFMATRGHKHAYTVIQLHMLTENLRSLHTKLNPSGPPSAELEINELYTRVDQSVDSLKEQDAGLLRELEELKGKLNTRDKPFDAQAALASLQAIIDSRGPSAANTPASSSGGGRVERPPPGSPSSPTDASSRV